MKQLRLLILCGTSTALALLITGAFMQSVVLFHLAFTVITLLLARLLGLYIRLYNERNGSSCISKKKDDLITSQANYISSLEKTVETYRQLAALQRSTIDFDNKAIKTYKQMVEFLKHKG